MALKDLIKNKSILFGLIIVGIVILLAIFSSGDSPDTPSSSDSPLKKSGLQITNLTEEKKQRAVDYRRQIINQLPIHVTGFKTSVGITTSIDITALPGDSPETVNLAINGLSYLNRETNPSKNRNVKAYEESYREAMRLLRDRGIDPTKLIFTYGDRDYVAETTAVWISALKLEP